MGGGGERVQRTCPNVSEGHFSLNKCHQISSVTYFVSFLLNLIDLLKQSFIIYLFFKGKKRRLPVLFTTKQQDHKYIMSPITPDTHGIVSCFCSQKNRQ